MGYSAWGHKESDTIERLSTPIFCGPGAKNGFFIFKGLGEKIKRKITFYDIRKFYGIQVPCPLIKLYWDTAMLTH